MNEQNTVSPDKVVKNLANKLAEKEVENSMLRVRIEDLESELASKATKEDK